MNSRQTLKSTNNQKHSLKMESKRHLETTINIKNSNIEEQ